MNNRIEELAKEAGAYRIMDELRKSHMDGGKSFTPESFEKFCKLLIEECANVANDNYDKGFCPVGGFIIDHFKDQKV